MRIIFLFLFTFSCFVSFAQFGEQVYDTAYIKKHKIKSITEYLNDLTHKENEYDSGEYSNAVNDFIESRYFKFDQGGHIIDQNDYWDDSDNRTSKDYERESSEDILDNRNRVMERKYFEYGQYMHSEYFEYNNKGQCIVTRIKYNDQWFLKDSTVYDKKGNVIEVINGNWYSSTANRWVKKYDNENRVISSITYSDLNYLKSMDSFVYNKQGKLTEIYLFENSNGQMICFDKYLATYDNIGNKISEHRYQGKDLPLTSFIRYVYNNKNQLLQEVDGDGEVIYVYNDRGNLTEKRVYIRGNLQITYKWRYEYYSN